MLRATEEKLHDPERRSLNLRHKLNDVKKKLFKKPDDCRKTFCDWSNHRLESEF